MRTRARRLFDPLTTLSIDPRALCVIVSAFIDGDDASSSKLVFDRPRRHRLSLCSPATLDTCPDTVPDPTHRQHGSVSVTATSVSVDNRSSSLRLPYPSTQSLHLLIIHHQAPYLALSALLIVITIRHQLVVKNSNAQASVL